MNVLTNSISVRFGTLRYDSHATAVAADLALLPGVNAVAVSLPPQVRVTAGPGDDAVLRLNNGEGSATVLTGTVRQVRRGPRLTQVIAADCGAALAAARPAQSYRDMIPGRVIQAIAGDLGVDAISLLPGLDPMPIYVADQRRTAAQHVARLAELGGGFAHVDAQGTVRAAPWPFLPPLRALLQGREVIDYVAGAGSGGVDVAFAGASPAAAGADPRAFAQTVDPVAAGADDPAPAMEWQARPALRSPLAVSVAARAASAARVARQARMEATCWLLPDLRPSDVIEVQGLADGVSGGPWMLTHVVHDLRRTTGGVTRIRGMSAASPGLMGDALGGLA